MPPVIRNGHPYVPYQPDRLQLDESRLQGTALLEHLDARRSVRDFVADPVPRELVETAIRAASTAPSGAHMQPWTFVAISDPTIKAKIRVAAEEEERRSYEGRMSDEWIEALAPLGTDWQKPYLEVVPWIVVLFAQRWGTNPDGSRRKHYYVQESCGIAAGLFVAALHRMGLCTLTHTPSPMGFLADILQRPDNEKAMILFPVGYAAPDALVPDLARKELSEVSVWFEGS
ncbi:MAG: nitroreductase family protein [Myxococcales bacterium]|nr:nitroreductase family protein [Myxococcales bacterium]